MVQFDYYVILYTSKTSKHLIKHITQYLMSVIDLTFRLSNQPQFSLIYWITDLKQSFRIVIIEFTNRLSVLYYVFRQPVRPASQSGYLFFIFSFSIGRARLLTYCKPLMDFATVLCVSVPLVPCCRVRIVFRNFIFVQRPI